MGGTRRSEDELKSGHAGAVRAVVPAEVRGRRSDLGPGRDAVAAAEEMELRIAGFARVQEDELARLAGRVYDARRDRDRTVGDALFGEPAWDMLVALYALPERGIALGVTSLSDAACLPPATGLRWQKILLERGLIEEGPSTDNRERPLRLKDEGWLLVERFLMRLF